MDGGERASHHPTFTFPDFKQALDFVNRVGEVAEQQGHHPDILLAWGKAEITLWTHKIDGLTQSDFIMAAKIDQLHIDHVGTAALGCPGRAKLGRSVPIATLSSNPIAELRSGGQPRAALPTWFPGPTSSPMPTVAPAAA